MTALLLSGFLKKQLIKRRCVRNISSLHLRAQLHSELGLESGRLCDKGTTLAEFWHHTISILAQSVLDDCAGLTAGLLVAF